VTCRHRRLLGVATTARSCAGAFCHRSHPFSGIGSPLAGRSLVCRICSWASLSSSAEVSPRPSASSNSSSCRRVVTGSGVVVSAWRPMTWPSAITPFRTHDHAHGSQRQPTAARLFPRRSPAGSCLVCGGDDEIVGGQRSTKVQFHTAPRAFIEPLHDLLQIGLPVHP